MAVETNSTKEEWISSEEKVLVEKLRERIGNDFPKDELSKPKEDQDAFLLRWIRAREMNLDKAENLLRTTLQWRKDNKAGDVLKQEIDPFVLENYRWTFVAPDHSGSPVGICPIYEWDFRKMIAAKKSDKFDLLIKYFFETILEDIRNYSENRKPGLAPITQFSPIIDCAGFPYGQLMNFTAMRKWFQMAATYESYYPEILKRVIFINCPSFFPMFINMLKPFLCQRTLAKFTCYPSTAAWQKDIDKFVDPALIPEQYGGTSKTNPLMNRTQG